MVYSIINTGNEAQHFGVKRLFCRQLEKFGSATAILTVSFVLGSFLPGTVHAQDQDDDVFTLEEIVVKARKRSESQQDVPVSVTSFGSNELKAFKFFDNVDLGSQVPGLDVRNAGIPASNVFIRGIGSNDFNENNSNPVATYDDEVYISSNVGSNIPIYDMERIEVLKGPQGTLYGKNTTGGAISYFSKRPDGELSGQGSFTYGRFNEVRIEGGVGFPIIEGKLSGRVSFYSNQRDGTDINLFDGTDQNQRNTQALRAQLLFTPTENVDFLLKVSGHKRRSDLGTGQPRGLVNPATGALDLAAFEDGSPRLIPGFTNLAGYEDTDPDPFRNSHEGPDKLNLDDLNVTGILNVDMENINITSITGYIDHKQRLLSDPDFSPTSLLHVRRDNDVEQISQEIRVSSNASGRFQWMVGGYFFEENIDANVTFDIIRDLLPPGASFFIDQKYKQKTTNYSAFAHTTYEISEKLTLTAGLRYTYEKRDFGQINQQIESDGITDITPGAVIATLIPQTSLSNNWGELSGKIGLDYHVNEDLMLFASISRGFKSGGFTGGALVDPAELRGFDPETLIAYEAGFKSEWYDKRLRLNVSAFYYNYSDLQVFVFRPSSVPGAFVQTFENAADATIYGAEIEVTALPVENLLINFGVGLLSSKYKNFIDGTGVDFSDNELINAPNLDINGSLTYGIPLENGNEVELRTDGSYVSKRFFSSSNSERLSSGGGHTNINLSMSYILIDENIELQAWVKNVFDEIDPIDVVDLSSVGVDLFWFTDPRTYGVTLNFRF